MTREVKVAVRAHYMWWSALVSGVEKRERLLLLVGAAAAVIVRAGWALLRTGSGSQGEAHNIAVALASGRGFADAFHVGDGPTDHLMPTTPVWGGAIYSLFGINSPLSEFILWTAATGLVVGSYLIYYRAFARTGTPRWARLAAFWFLCLAPTYVQQESSDYRVWEGALAAFLCALFLDRLLALLHVSKVRTADILVMALLAAATFFTKPPAGLGLYVASGLFCILNLRNRQFVTAAVAAPIALALFLVPWALRNEAVMGQYMPMRDNAGLELALSQYDGALAPTDGRERRLARYEAIHPMGSGSGSAQYASMGEVQYYKMLGRETKQWMRTHPPQVAEIIAMHLGQIVAPPTWLFRLWGNGTLATLRSLCASFAGILGIAGLLAGLVCGRREWKYLAAFIVPPLLAYLLFQPLPRYIYLFYAPFAFSATGLVLMVERLRRSEPAPA